MKGTAAIKRNHGIIYNIDRKNTTQRRYTRTKKDRKNEKKRIKTLTKDYNKGC